MKRTSYYITILSSLLLLVALCSCGPTESPTATGDRGRLSIEAQSIYNAGGPQPVAHDTFYLLDADLLDVEVPKAPEPRKGVTREEVVQAMSRLTPAQQLKLMIMIAQYNKTVQEAARQRGVDTPDTPANMARTIGLNVELLKREKATHFIQAATTDFQGRTTFESIEPGDYWIMGATQTRADFAFWNHKVSIKPGENKVLLDQSNALYSR